MVDSARDFSEQLLMRRIAKDSVFASLFSDKKYVLQLYRDLHPEDKQANVEDIEIVTIQNVLVSDQHNDLGFTVGDRLLILVEAQSTWSPNIVLRALLYAAQTIKDHIRDHKLDVYGSTPVKIPLPELYVVYTGAKADVPQELTLSETVFGGRPAGIDSRVRILTESGPTIAGQYIDFAKTLDAFRVELGPTEKAVKAAISACRERGVLSDYLANHEKEVVSIMVTLYDEQEVMRNHIASECRIARSKALAEGLAEGRTKGLAEGRATGLAEGLAEGRTKGLAEGRATGLAEGRAEGRAEGIASMCKEFGLSREQTVGKLAECLGISASEAERTLATIW